MSSIQNKQDETDEELRATLERLQATEMKTAAAQGKASQERGLIKQDVDVVRNELSAVRYETIYIIIACSHCPYRTIQRGGCGINHNIILK